MSFRNHTLYYSAACQYSLIMTQPNNSTFQCIIAWKQAQSHSLTAKHGHYIQSYSHRMMLRVFGYQYLDTINTYVSVCYTVGCNVLFSVPYWPSCYFYCGSMIYFIAVCVCSVCVALGGVGWLPAPNFGHQNVANAQSWQWHLKEQLFVRKYQLLKEIWYTNIFFVKKSMKWKRGF